MIHRSSKIGFTLIEIVVSIAVFAIVAVPTVGLMTMSARKTNNSVGYSGAAQLKVIIENEVRASSENFGASAWDLDTDSIALYASRDLKLIAFSDEGGFSDADKFYRIDLSEPVGYDFGANDSYRCLVFTVIWPAFQETSPGVFASNEANLSNLEQMIMTSVIRRE